MSKKTKKAQDQTVETPQEGTQQEHNQNNAAEQNDIESKESNHEASNEPSPEDALGPRKGPLSEIICRV